MNDPIQAELINRGDGITRVRELLGIKEDHPPYEGTGSGFKYHFPESGIWIFFGEAHLQVMISRSSQKPSSHGPK